jgi:hypothetical protein
MTGRALVLILIATLSLAASWLLGYREGQVTGAFRLLHEMGEEDARDEHVGIDKGRDQVCNEIRRYKFSMAKDLDENTEICGWPDMDGPNFSN